jgi:hypothetical protein
MNKLIKSIGEAVRDRISAARLSPVEEEIRKFILRTFAASGRPPTPAEIQDGLKPTSLDTVRQAVKRLEEADLLVTKDGEVISSYPFSAKETRHTVVFDDGREVYALCATDALGISFMLKEDIKVNSRCPHCAGEITLVIKDGKVRSKNPHGVVELVTGKGEEGQTAKVSCPYMNFFCSRQCLEGWGAGNPGYIEGELYTVEQAVEHGRWIFEDFLAE